MTPSFESKDVQTVTPNPVLLTLAILPFTALIILPILAVMSGTPGFLFPMVHFGILGTVLTMLVLRRKPSPSVRAAHVVANADGVTINGRHTPRSELKDGFIVPNHRPIVRLRRHGVRFAHEIAVGSIAEGRRLLSALGFDASQSVARLDTLSRIFANYPLFIAAGIGTMVLTFVFMMLLAPIIPPAYAVFAMAMGWVVASVARSHVSVGADGVLVTWLTFRRFIPMSEIENVVFYEEGFGNTHWNGVRIITSKGNDLRIPMSSSRWDTTSSKTLLERIEEAIDVYKHGGIEAEAALLGRPHDLPIAAWIQKLRAIGAGVASLRTAPVDRDRLWAIVESAQAPATDRAAAAVALGADFAEPEKARLRVAAEAVAEPRLRIALKSVEEGNEEEIAAALEEISTSATSSKP